MNNSRIGFVNNFIITFKWVSVGIVDRKKYDGKQYYNMITGR